MAPRKALGLSINDRQMERGLYQFARFLTAEAMLSISDIDASDGRLDSPCHT